MLDDRYCRLFMVGYALALALILVPAIEVIVQAWPPTPTAVRWRYGLLGYLGNELGLPTIGYVTAVLTAALVGHRRALKALSAASLVGALLLALMAILFLLDAVQIRNTVNPEIMKSFDSASIKALLSFGLTFIIFLWMGWTGWKAARPRQSKDKRDHAGLVAATPDKVIPGTGKSSDQQAEEAGG